MQASKCATLGATKVFYFWGRRGGICQLLWGGVVVAGIRGRVVQFVIKSEMVLSVLRQRHTFSACVRYNRLF